MIINNLRTTFRHLANQKLNTSLHIVGLTLGICVCLTITLFILHELSFDAYQSKASRTYRVTSYWQDGSKRNPHYSTPFPMTEALRANGTAFEHVALAHPHPPVVIDVNPEKKFSQRDVLIINTEFLDVFTVEAIAGNPREVIAKPYQALLTESTAKKFYGSENPVGRTFTYKNEFEVTVGGVIKDFPGNTHLKPSMLLSYVSNETYLGTSTNYWSSISGTTAYFVLKEGSALATVQKQLDALADQHINSDPNLPKHVRAGFEIQPLSKIHFQPEYAGGGPYGGAINTSWLWIFASIGLAVLFLACINFINLSTAQALTRGREVGVRKSVGAGRSQLILQFLMEPWLLALISGVIAVTIVQSLLPALNTLLEKQISFHLGESLGLLGGILAGILILGLLAGLYPAIVIARFNPASTLKGSSPATNAPGSQWVRSSLMVTQFVISAGLLVAVLLISDQVKYLRTRSLGFDKENILNIPIPFGQNAKLETQLGDISQLKDFSFATATPSSEGHWGTVMSPTDGDDPNRHNVTLLLADDHFAAMYDLKLVSGRFNQPSDTSYVSRSLRDEEKISKCVVNEALVKALSIPSNDKAIGTKFWFGMGNGKAEIVGVVKDFNTTSLHSNIQPTVIASMPGMYSQVGIKLHANTDLPATVAEIQKRWQRAFPNEVFEYNFLDQQIDSYYKAEARIHTLFQIFAGTSMLISCLGLWGLASLAAQQRTKEIGIRKILGASTNAVFMLLSKDFIIMVVVALAIASPLAYYLMSEWLSNFAFHISIGMSDFLIAAGLSVLFALLTVSFQTLKAAVSNPVKSLRSE